MVIYYYYCIINLVQVGRTALFLASWKGHVEVVKLLLQKHADVNIARKDVRHNLYYN